MDNLFEYLIYGFIILSFISSFFKKKKHLPKESSGQSPHQRTEITKEIKVQTPVPQQPKAEEYDILKEMESFFNVGQPQQTRTMVHTDKKMSEMHTDKKMSESVKDRENYIPVPEKSFHKITDSEHTFTDPWDVKRKELGKRKMKLSPKIEKQESAYEESLTKKDSAATGIIKDIKERLKNPSTLKEYIIISEIIGKPKALKR